MDPTLAAHLVRVEESRALDLGKHVLGPAWRRESPLMPVASRTTCTTLPTV
jgi:hypothetical protein